MSINDIVKPAAFTGITSLLTDYGFQMPYLSLAPLAGYLAYLHSDNLAGNKTQKIIAAVAGTAIIAAAYYLPEIREFLS